MICAPSPKDWLTRTARSAWSGPPRSVRHLRHWRAAIWALLICAAGTVAADQPALSQSWSGGVPAYARGDYTTAAKRLPIAAERGDARAQALLGFMYANGRGVPQNYVIAVRWYASAAERGNPTAQYLLGLMYDKGQGVPRDDVLAHMWLNLAAAHARPREREYFVRIRDAVATKMSASQLATAQWLAYRRGQHF